MLLKKGLEREPTVTITSPSPGEMFGFGAPMLLSADVGDSTMDVSSVEFLMGATSLGKAVAKPFSVMSISPAVGNITITATATDTTLATGVSAPVMFVGNGDSPVPGGGVGGAAGAGGAAGVGGGPTNGGMPIAGTATTGGSSGTTGAGAPNGAITPAETSAGCGCAVPTSRGSSAAALIALSLVLLGLRRAACCRFCHAAPTMERYHGSLVAAQAAVLEEMDTSPANTSQASFDESRWPFVVITPPMVYSDADFGAVLARTTREQRRSPSTSGA